MLRMNLFIPNRSTYMPTFVPRSIIFVVILVLSSFIAIAVASAEALINPESISLPKGYKIEAVVKNLSVPTTAIFDNEDLLVAESGFANTAAPRIVRISSKGEVSIVASEGLRGPVTGLLMFENKLYVSHRGKVSIVGNDGKLQDIVTGLPSEGDHQNNNIVKGPDGKIYMGQGTTTNSGVVGIDNFANDWLQDSPKAHDVPCVDITLQGINYETENPLTKEDDMVTTGAYKAFGIPSEALETIKGNEKCSGSILRFNPDGTGLEMYAWGMRNPYGLEFDSNGHLWSTFHGADVRGSRDIFDDPDYLVEVKKDAWYGWPDYFDGESVEAGRFNALGEPAPQTLWTKHPPLTEAYLTIDPHEAANGLDFSPGGKFGYKGDAFVAMFGTFTPITTGINIKPVGFRVARVNLKNREVVDFASNKVIGPSYLNRQGGFNRPSDVVFGPDDSLYVVDWGAAVATEKGIELVPGTGLVWRIYKDDQKALRPNGAIAVPVKAEPKDERRTLIRNVAESYKMLSSQIFLLVVLPIIAILVTLYFFKKAIPPVVKEIKHETKVVKKIVKKNVKKARSKRK